MRRAVFLDRDGTIIENIGYLRHPQDVRLLPGAADGIRMLNRDGWLVIVVTNQSAIARGLLTVAELEAIHRTIDALLLAEGARVDAWYYCPHHPDGCVKEYATPCECRKPKPGMLVRAAREHNIVLAESWTMGDSVTDVLAGQEAGTRVLHIGEDVYDLLEGAKIVVGPEDVPRTSDGHADPGFSNGEMG